MSQLRNLDRLAASTAQAIVGEKRDKEQAEKLENMATKALGVVQENGVYAGMLVLYSRPDDAQAKAIRVQLLTMLNAPELAAMKLGFTGEAATAKWPAVSQHFIDHVTCDLDKLLLVKELYEQTLIYVRYGAKAAQG